MRLRLTANNAEKQHFVSAGSDMRVLSKPLKSLGIEVFARVRIWKDQSISLLTTHPSFSVLFVKEKFYEFAFAGKPEEYASGIILLDDAGLNCSKIQRIKSAFVEHCRLKLDLSIIERHELYTDLYWFGTSFNVVNTGTFYLNKIGLLKAYIKSVKQSGEALFARSEQYRLIYPGACADKTFLTSPKFHRWMNMPESISRLDQFTEKEQSCLALLKQGVSVKKMACVLNKSPRTIEKHLLNARKKTGKKSLLELAVCLNDFY